MGLNGSSPHVDGAQRSMEGTHVYGDIMRLVDLLLFGKPTTFTEHARPAIEFLDKAYQPIETGKVQESTSTFQLIALEVVQSCLKVNPSRKRISVCQHFPLQLGT